MGHTQRTLQAPPPPPRHDPARPTSRHTIQCCCWNVRAALVSLSQCRSLWGRRHVDLCRRSNITSSDPAKHVPEPVLYRCMTATCTSPSSLSPTPAMTARFATHTGRNDVTRPSATQWRIRHCKRWSHRNRVTAVHTSSTPATQCCCIASRQQDADRTQRSFMSAPCQQDRSAQHRTT